MEWQPIESAPKSGDYIRLWNGREQGDGYWEAWGRDPDGKLIGLEHWPDQSVFVDQWKWCGEGFTVEPPPTHWMPLPEPPKTR